MTTTAKRAITAAPEPPEPLVELNGKDEPVGPARDDDFVFETSAGTITIRSMAKGRNPRPFAMMKARKAQDYDTMTLLVLEAKAGDQWDEISAILEQLEEDEFNAFTEGWVKHSGINQGELPAS